MDRVKGYGETRTPALGWSGARRVVRVVDGGTVRGSRPSGPGSRAAMSGENLVGLIVAVALIIFLIAALLFPERF